MTTLSNIVANDNDKTSTIMEPKDIENPIAEADFRHQLREEKRVLDLSNVSSCLGCYHYPECYTRINRGVPPDYTCYTKEE